MANTNDRMLVGTRKGLFEARRQNGRWSLEKPTLAGLPIPYALLDDRTNNVWASIDHGHWGPKLARGPDGGKLEETPGPTYPEATGKAARYYWILAPGPGSHPESFWIGTEPGGLFTSEDDGATWALNGPLWKLRVDHEWQGGGRDEAGIHSICFDPRDPQHAYVGISCAGVVETRDGGATWAYCNQGVRKVFDTGDADYGHDPHCVALAPSDPEVLWQANHCGVFRTASGGAAWDDLTDKPLVHFGFPVAVHPHRAATAWLVPMESDQKRTTVEGRLRVMRTDDGGKTWAEQGEGLPESSWDFPFRHALDVGADGDTLAFGTTSGNLYASADGGASWEAISHNLPPVYSVRFA